MQAGWHLRCYSSGWNEWAASAQAGPGLLVGGYTPMVLKSALAVGLVLGLFAPNAWADRRSDAKAQVGFGIRMAQANLWREAIYRFERAVEIDPTYAAAYNNLAVAYEQAGQVEKACAAYMKALQLKPKNLLIAQNHDLFEELHVRPTKRDDR